MDALAEASDDISGFHTVVTFDDDFSGFDTVVTFDDDIHVYVDPETDGLEGALGQQPGIEDVFAEDREVVYLRTRLALVDVRAATLRRTCT